MGIDSEYAYKCSDIMWVGGQVIHFGDCISWGAFSGDSNTIYILLRGALHPSRGLVAAPPTSPPYPVVNPGA